MNHGPHNPFAPGSRYGPYAVVRCIGRGASASVFLAEDTRVDPPLQVALKVLDPARLTDEDLRRFAREHARLSQLHHPNVVSVFERGEDHGHPWLAMEYVDGCDLDALIGRWRERPSTDRFALVAQLVQELAEGLAHVHSHGLVHRDIKPANVLVTQDGHAKLTDFGVVRCDDVTSQVTTIGQLVGTVAYMAPEAIDGTAVDARTDLYGLGAVLYVLLTLRRPFEADSIEGYLAKQLSELPPAPLDLDPDVPPHLDRLAMRLLSKSASERPSSAQAVLATLAAPQTIERPPLRGRDDAVLLWQQHLQALRHGAGGNVFLRGPSGSGKSHLLSIFVTLAAEQGVLVRTAEQFRQPPHPITFDKPLVVWADDLDKQPESVLQALATAVRLSAQAPCLVVYANAEACDRICPLINGARGGGAAEIVEMNPLGPYALQQILRDRGVPQSVAAALRKRAPAEGAYPGELLELMATLVEAGWLAPAQDRLRSCRNIKVWNEADLPVPPRVHTAVTAQLDALAPDATELLELLALLGRPASVEVLSQAAGRTAHPRALIDHLRGEGLLIQSPSDAQETVSLHDRHLATILRQRIPPRRLTALHLNLAQALGYGRRRRQASAELADHLAAAGKPEEAAPIYLRAAKRAVRGRRHEEALALWERHNALGDEPTQATAIAYQRLAGNALVVRRRYRRAVEVLQPQVRADLAAQSPATDPAVHGSMVDLGRALYRLGRHAEARAMLEPAQRDADPSGTTWPQATRALADILMRSGEVQRAEAMLTEALHTATQQRSVDGEARVRRGLGHVRALHNDFLGARHELERADELMLDEHPYVRAGVLARAIEVDLALGRLGIARHRADQLVSLLRAHSLGDRLPRALSLQATVDLAAGQRRLASQRAQEALRTAAALTRPSAQAMLRAARVQVSLDVLDELGKEALSAPLHDDLLSDPRGQQIALLARAAALDGHEGRAKLLAEQAIERPATPWSLPRVHLLLDAGHALMEIGDLDGAIHCAQEARAAVQPAAPCGVLLQTWTLLHQAGAEGAAEALQHLCRQTASTLHPDLQRGFWHRAQREA